MHYSRNSRWITLGIYYYQIILYSLYFKRKEREKLLEELYEQLYEVLNYNYFNVHFTGKKTLWIFFTTRNKQTIKPP